MDRCTKWCEAQSLSRIAQGEHWANERRATDGERQSRNCSNPECAAKVPESGQVNERYGDVSSTTVKASPGSLIEQVDRLATWWSDPNYGSPYFGMARLKPNVTMQAIPPQFVPVPVILAVWVSPTLSSVTITDPLNTPALFG